MQYIFRDQIKILLSFAKSTQGVYVKQLAHIEGAHKPRQLFAFIHP